ncbi:MAG: hypothetical protein MK538_19375 [Planctomycetes bacterium]|nr:hypothetical protein [Planctomycetota bacterium]
MLSFTFDSVKECLACAMLDFPQKRPVSDALESKRVHYRMPKIADF